MMLPTPRNLASAHSKVNQATGQALTHLLNYESTHPDATLCFSSRDMVLQIHSDASYLSKSKSCSRSGGQFLISSKPKIPGAAPGLHDPPPPNNGSVHTISSIIKNIISLETEAEFGGIFLNTKVSTILCTYLHEMVNLQPPTPITAYNTTSTGIENKTVK